MRRPKVSTHEVLGGHFNDILGLGPTCKNRCFVGARAQSDRFWKVQEPSNCEMFFKRGKKCGLGRHFSDFSDFGVPLGVQNGSIFGKTCSFSEVWNFDDF